MVDLYFEAMATISLGDNKILVVKFIRDIDIMFWPTDDLGTSHKVKNGSDKHRLESLFI